MFYFAHRPASSSTSTSTASRRSTQPLKGVEVTLDFKFRYARPGLLVPLETQLKIGSIASHAVSPDMAAGKIKITLVIKGKLDCASIIKD